MNFSFSEFWEAVKDCRQMNTNFNGGKISLDAAVALYQEVKGMYGSAVHAVEGLGLSENQNLTIWTECVGYELAQEADEHGFDSVMEYARSFPDRYKVAPHRWLLRCE